ncbi:hypothetical protein [Mycobacteroides chelonae]|uniref:hypothetical protein n=1 Tax=Mycobacteroides chelonae TaxID=1774 RepID=UPI003569F63A
MARSTKIALPEDDYLVLVGQVAYMVGSLEWTVLGDVPRWSQHLPADLTAGALAGEPTGVIGRKLRSAADKIAHDQVRNYIETAGQILGDAAKLRNDVLHARAATSEDGFQRLYRWKEKPQCAFFITTEWLERAIDQLSEASASLGVARVAAASA